MNIFKRISNFFAEQQRKMEEQLRLEKEREAELARLEQERLAAEKAALMELSEKELMADTIMMLRALDKRIAHIEEVQEELLSRVN